MIKLIRGDCLKAMVKLESCSVDSIITDPPYGLKFMGKNWDHGLPGVAFWKEMLRVAKPGCHLLAFGGTRKYHRVMCAIEDAGWEIRDCIMWVYGSGWPKSLDVSKAIDKKLGGIRTEGKREWKGGLGHSNSFGGGSGQEKGTTTLIKYDIPATEVAKQWNGWGMAIKPAWEPIILARKPLDGTVAENILEWGCGGLNIDGCRVGSEELNYCTTSYREAKTGAFSNQREKNYITGNKVVQGRFPANLIHDGSEEVTGLFPDNAGNCKGSAARFFYCAKASKKDRDEGLEGLERKKQDTIRKEGNPGGNNPRNRGVHLRGNYHPTVKPTKLMQYLCRLVTSKEGIILDPFMGSGSTGKAAILEGFNFIGIEKEKDYLNIAYNRIKAVREGIKNKVKRCK